MAMAREYRFLRLTLASGVGNHAELDGIHLAQHGRLDGDGELDDVPLHRLARHGGREKLGSMKRLYCQRVWV